jgi:hypothetical protein
VLSPSATLVAPALRILDPEEAEECARNRQAWGDLWCAIARELDADPLDDPRNDEKATAEDSAIA